MTKNKKAFIAVMQIKKKKIRARIYRVKRNRTKNLGFIKFKKMPVSVQERDDLVIEFLRYKGHVGVMSVLGVDFSLETV